MIGTFADANYENLKINSYSRLMLQFYIIIILVLYITTVKTVDIINKFAIKNTSYFNINIYLLL